MRDPVAGSSAARSTNPKPAASLHQDLKLLPCYAPEVPPWYAVSGELDTLNFIIVNTPVLVLPWYAVSGELHTLSFIIVNTPVLVLPWFALSGELHTLNVIIVNTPV